MQQFLVHASGDDVGVAVEDLAPGSTVTGLVLDNGESISVEIRQPIPLGHKVALRGLARGARVIEYGSVIGSATADIGIGEHVHVHNLESLRWARPSTAAAPVGAGS